jgi:TonB family protein
VGLGVVAVHCIFVQAFWANTVGLPLAGGRGALSVRWIGENPELPPLPIADPPIAPPRLRSPSLDVVPLIQSPDVPVGSIGVPAPAAKPTGPPFERLVVEAEPEDAAVLREFCNRSYPRESAALNEYGTVVLMIRVESDGHVSDSRIEETSGSSWLDKAAQDCVTGVGLFEPHRAGIRAVASWQRIHWVWSPAT